MRVAPEAGGPRFVDSSFIIRYLTGDLPALSDAAAAIIDGEAQLVLTELVLVETAYVLESVYQVPRGDVVDALGALMQRSNIVPLGLPKAMILSALELCRGSRRVSFVDALTWAQARHAHAGHVYTFDRRFPADGVAAGPTCETTTRSGADAGA